MRLRPLALPFALAAGLAAATPALQGALLAAPPVAGEEAPSAQERARLSAEAARAPRLRPEALAARLARGEAILILDVRSREAFERGHIRGALSHPRSTLAHSLQGLPRGLPIVTYCSCAEDFNAALAAMALQRAGFASVAALQGGLYAWQDAKLPLEGPPAPLDGAGLYAAHCATCHGLQGEGQRGLVPGLKPNPWVQMPSAKPLLTLLLGGVNSGRYPLGMPGFARLSDAELAALASHLRGAFGGPPGRIAPAAARAARREWQDEAASAP